MNDNSRGEVVPDGTQTVTEQISLEQIDLTELLPYCVELTQSISAEDANWQCIKLADWPTIVDAFYAKLKEIASRVRRKHLCDPDSHESDSLVNEAFLKVAAARSPSDFATPGHFLSYMCKTIRTIRLESKRAQVTRSRHLAQMSAATCRSAKNLAQDDEGRLRLQCDEILMKKDLLLLHWKGHPDAVTMYQLHTESETTHREIAGLFGVGKSTVTDRIGEVREYLRRGLKEIC